MDRVITANPCVIPVAAHFDKDGYPRKKWNKRLWRMNRLVWTWCYGKIPKDSVVAHRCNNKGCVNPTHLYLCSAPENSTHAAIDGLYKSGERNGRARLTTIEVGQIRDAYEDGVSQKDIALLYGVGQSTISSIIRKGTWKND